MGIWIWWRWILDGSEQTEGLFFSFPSVHSLIYGCEPNRISINDNLDVH
jgi:hypothetical protein